MAIYIKGAYKPVNCQLCIKSRLANAIKCKARDNTTSLQRAFSTAKDCPITQIPEPHGRLIDADKVGWAKYNQDVGYLTQYQQGWNDGVDRTLREIDDTPTVIEGSE